MLKKLLNIIPVFALFAPLATSAHEVYVLPQETVQAALNTPRFSDTAVIMSNIEAFAFWGFIAMLIIFVVFFVSISRTLEKWLDPMWAKLPPFAPVISRVTIGLSFIAAAYYGALFGPELPLETTFFGFAHIITICLVIIGFMITFGFYARVAALAAIALFGVEVWVHGSYMLTYSNYMGELILLLILGAHQVSVHHKGHDVLNAPKWFMKLKEALTPYAFLILRVGFGISLLYASLYAKVINNNLALEVAYAYPSLVQFFGFEPHFLVLGASIIEILIALFFIFGIEIRFASLFLLFWLSLSLWYFGETVWPHVILIGIPIALIFYGYDKYSIEGRLFKKGGREPVL